jgi:signal transduction histidine kinase
MGTRGASIVGRRRNGEEFPADAAISVLDVEGTRVLTAVVRDITEQKRIENEQRFLAEVGPALADTLDYEETLSRIAEIAARGFSDFCIVDLVDEKGAIHRLRAVCRDSAHAWVCEILLGIALDRRWHLVRSAVESKQSVLMQHPSFEDIEAVPQNDDYLRALNTLNLQSVIVIPLLAHGKVLGAISFLSLSPSRAFGAEDLRLANELALRAALAVDNARLYGTAQRATQVRDEVLGIVAHDLRNPLAAIRLEASFLCRTELTSDSRSRSLDSAEAITRSATRMDRLIQDLLDVTRMDAGKLAIEQSRLASAQVAAEVFELHRALAAPRGLELRLSLSQELPDIWADRDRLRQIFDNLIGNAIKFTPSGGSITLGAAPRDTDVLFWVADSGPGIALEDHPHLFDRFWQARAGGRAGAGLGLPIVKGIVDAHQGHVWVESAPGHGSTFFFTIPTAEHVERTSGHSAQRPAILDAAHESDPSPSTNQ